MDLDGLEYEPDTFTRGTEVYDRPTSIHHWQLRDLISPASEHEFFCVHKQAVLLYDAARRQSKVVMNLGFSPNSMTCRNGYLAAGGLHSELEVRCLTTDTLCFKGSLGSQVNNALHVGRAPGGAARLFVCNNDDTIKVFALPSMVPLATIRCHVAPNYAALSPDGRTLVCVGDCRSTLLYSTGEAGYSLAATMTEAHDVGMCAAWNDSGRLFASAHQDGRCAVWDVGSGKVVAKYDFPNNAARNVKFAKGPVDLMAVSEHEDCVHLVDARRWDRVQELLPAPNGDGDISGIAFSASGLRLWVGLEDCCAGFDIDSLERRTFGVEAMRL